MSKLTTHSSLYTLSKDVGIFILAKSPLRIASVAGSMVLLVSNLVSNWGTSENFALQMPREFISLGTQLHPRCHWQVDVEVFLSHGKIFWV